MSAKNRPEGGPHRRARTPQKRRTSYPNLATGSNAGRLGGAPRRAESWPAWTDLVVAPPPVEPVNRGAKGGAA
jgi:hypothetical protein